MSIDETIALVKKIVGGRVDGIIAVKGGVSGAKTYRAKIEGKEWMVKVLPSGNYRLEWYNQLALRATEKMANPKYLGEEKGNLCLISPWINGENLEEKLDSLSLSQVDKLGREGGEILSSLHQKEIDYPLYQKAVKDKVCCLINKVNEYGLSFPGKKDCVEFLQKKIKEECKGKIYLTHRDVRPENFILNEKGLYLIDFENGSVGERGSDFVYCTTMGKPEHRRFYHALIEEYLTRVDYKEFWKDNLFYSTMQLLEYAVWKWENREKQVKEQAENLIYQYDNFTSIIPAWWRNY